MRRREFIAALSGAAVWPLIAQAQRPPLPVIGFLNSASADRYKPMVAAFRQGLKETGYLEGQNVAVEYRWAEGQYDRVPAMAAELVGRQVAVIVANTPGNLAAKAATTTIPVVFTISGDPVLIGLVASLSRPGGNVTGVAQLNVEVGFAESETKELQDASALLGVRLLIVNATVPDEFESAFATLVQQRAGGLLISGDPMFSNRADQLVALAARHSVPTVYRSGSAVTAGGLMSYTVNFADSYRQLGVYVGRILKGEKPADMPVQRATKIELVINMKTAKALGLTVPRTILGRADAVIE
jgi:putative ABC transport system substrate-binding protein